MNASDQLSTHFRRGEFACRCGCGTMSPSPELIHLLQSLRDRLGKPIKIVSGHRCERHNARVKGAKRSLHLTGQAADIQVTGMSPKSVAMAVEWLMGGKGGLKAYATFTHIDVRPGRWRG